MFTTDDKKENDFKLLNEFWRKRGFYEKVIENPTERDEVKNHAKSVLQGISKTFEQASELQVQVLRLFYDEGLEYEEIADELFIRKTKAKNLHKRAIEQYGENIGFI